MLEALRELGAKAENITVLVGSGLHPPAPAREIEAMLGKYIYRHYPVVVHDAVNSPMEYVGETSHGTPIRLHKDYVAADIHIATGAIEPHQLAGFSAGIKAVFIGLGSAATIRANHALMLAENIGPGIKAPLNPLRADMEELQAMLPIDLLVNVVLKSRDRSAGSVRRAL